MRCFWDFSRAVFLSWLKCSDVEPQQQNYIQLFILCLTENKSNDQRTPFVVSGLFFIFIISLKSEAKTRSTIKSLKSLQSERIISRIFISYSLICYPIKPIMMLINAAYSVWCHLGFCHLCGFSTAYLISMSTTSNTNIKSAKLKTGSP